MSTIEECRRRVGVALTAFILVGGALLFAPQAASAQTGSCIQDVWAAHGNSQQLTCSAKDVSLSQATNINILSGGDCDPDTGVCRCFAGQMVTFTATFQMDLTAQTRYDVGFYIETGADTSNDGALTGQCTATVSLAGNTLNFTNLDAAPDVCGEIDAAHNPLFVTSQPITTQCPTGAGEQLVLDWCTTWRQPGSNQVCQGVSDAFPGAPSKCNCGDLAINIFSAPVDFTVTKTAVTTSVPESGGSATYSVEVHNVSTVADLTLTSLVDTPYGDITQVQGSVTQTNCQVPQTIAPSGTYSCTFVATVPPGNVGGSFTDVVQACGHNVANPEEVCRTDDATVTYLDVPQAPTLVKAVTGTQCQIDVTYTVVVTNNPGDDPTPGPLALSALMDDVYGDITQVQGNVISTTCVVPQVIAASTNYTCSFVGRINSCDTTLTDTVTGSATVEGANYTPTGSATIIVKVPSTPQ